MLPAFLATGGEVRNKLECCCNSAVKPALFCLLSEWLLIINESILLSWYQSMAINSAAQEWKRLFLSSRLNKICQITLQFYFSQQYKMIFFVYGSSAGFFFFFHGFHLNPNARNAWPPSRLMLKVTSGSKLFFPSMLLPSDVQEIILHFVLIKMYQRMFPVVIILVFFFFFFCFADEVQPSCSSIKANPASQRIKICSSTIIILHFSQSLCWKQ